MKSRIAAVVLGAACAASFPALAQQTSYSLGNSTQGGFPPTPAPVDFGPLPPSPASPGLDAHMLEAVSQALAADETLRGAEINVVVSGGTVMLSGSALTEAQAAYAKGLAAGVAGPGRVEGDLATR